MYASELMLWLHERLAEQGTYNQTLMRFEQLRGYDRLPRGRENAGVRLSNEQIANAVLGFVHPLPDYAGHASLILGDLKPVGGVKASFKNASTLQDALAKLIETEDAYSDLVRLTLSIEQDFEGDDYSAVLHFREDGQMLTVSFVSKYAHSILTPGAEKGYNHEQLDKLTAVQRSYGPKFFQGLFRSVCLSRQLDRPLETDWREYETEEEKANFNRLLGAKRSSQFLNLRVEAQVTWPKEPTRIEFGGHYLVLFPKTQNNSHSVSIDLTHEQISTEDARTLINRMLSVMCWCDDRPASLHYGWSGNPVPVPVPKQDLAFVTMNEWHFYREVPENEDLLRGLTFYRDGLNAQSVGLASHAVLSYFRVFELERNGNEIKNWIMKVFPKIESQISLHTLQDFKKFFKLSQSDDVGDYIYKHCRVASAHNSKKVRSDPDITEESRRLLNAAHIMQKLARVFIEDKFKFSKSYLTD